MFDKEWKEFEWFFKGCAQITPFVLGGFGGLFFGNVISRYFELNFYESLVCGILSTWAGGLVLGSVVWVIKLLSKKKLCALFYYEKINSLKYKASVLLWNPMNLRDVCDDDYGGDGFCILSSYDTILSSFNATKIIPAEKMNCSTKPNGLDNEINLRMDDILIKNIIELNFFISKKAVPTQVESAYILLPEYIKAKTPFDSEPKVSFLYNHEELKISNLKYNKIKQFAYRFFLDGIIVVSTLTLVLIILSITYSRIAEAFMLFTFGITSDYFLFFSLISIGDVIPPFVMKYIKTDGGAKYRKKVQKK